MGGANNMPQGRDVYVRRVARAKFESSYRAQISFWRKEATKPFHDSAAGRPVAPSILRVFENHTDERLFVKAQAACRAEVQEFVGAITAGTPSYLLLDIPTNAWSGEALPQYGLYINVVTADYIELWYVGAGIDSVGGVAERLAGYVRKCQHKEQGTLYERDCKDRHLQIALQDGVRVNFRLVARCDPAATVTAEVCLMEGILLTILDTPDDDVTRPLVYPHHLALVKKANRGLNSKLPSHGKLNRANLIAQGACQPHDNLYRKASPYEISRLKSFNTRKYSYSNKKV